MSVLLWKNALHINYFDESYGHEVDAIPECVLLPKIPHTSDFNLLWSIAHYRTLSAT